MKAAMQLHWKRITEEFMDEHVYPVLDRLGIESTVLPLDHNGHAEAAASADFILVLGGDGTFLTGANLALNAGIPIIGVMVGRLGFLCSISLDDLEGALQRIIDGSMPLEERHALNGQIIDADSNTRISRNALNDVVVFRDGTSNIRDFNAYHDGELIANYRADGIIVSSAVGSTAYTLAAGGPLVHPNLDVLVLTPVCAHSLFTKPLVLPRDALLQITFREGSYPLEVSYDGDHREILSDGESVTITSCGKRLKVYRPEGHEFYSVLQQKFQHGFLYGDPDA